MVFGFNLALATKLPAAFTAVVFNVHAPENPFKGGAVLEHNPNNIPNRNMFRNGVHVILICCGLGPTGHF
jgi:hypothetical protein